MTDIGTRIKLIRRQLGMSAEELGAAIGKDRATVYRYEAGDIKAVPSNIILRLAEALETTPAYLMGQTNDPKGYDELLDAYIDAEMPRDRRGRIDKDRLRAEYREIFMRDPRIFELTEHLMEMNQNHRDMIFSMAAEFAKLDQTVED